MNVAEFNRELEKWPPTVLAKDAVPMQRGILTDLVNGFIDETPAADPKFRGSGRAKRGWQVFLRRALAVDEPQAAVQDPTGTVAKAEAATVIGGITERPVPLATIANPVDYIEKLANGYSRQAPAGWFERVTATVSAKYSRVR